MSVSNLFKPGGLVWRPDANAINAPEGTLLRADNLVPDEDGALVVRRGSRELYNFPAGTEDIHSLLTFEANNGFTYRLMAADSQIYTNLQAGNHTAHWEVRHAEAAGYTVYIQRNYTGGAWEKAYASTGDVGPVPFSATWEETEATWAAEPINFNVTFDGTGDIAMGEDHQQAFFARGTTKRKFDGKNLLNWGIAKPSAVATLSSVAASSTDLMTGASGETGISYWPASLSDEGNPTVLATLSYVPDKNAAANQALKLTPGRAWGLTVASVWKSWGTPQNFSGQDEDVFSVDVFMEDAKNVTDISMTFFSDDYSIYYIYTFNPKEGIEYAVRDSKVDGENAYDVKVTSVLDPIDPKDKPRVNTPEKVRTIIGSIGDNNVPPSTPVTPTAGEWVRLAVTRKKFTKFGESATKSWSTIGQGRIEFRNTTGQKGAVYFSDWTLQSAGAGTMTGTYRVVYRFIRETDRYYESSPPSDESTEIQLVNNQLRVTIPAAAQNAADDQVTTVWAYVYGGFLDSYYRFATATVDPQKNATIVIDCTATEVDILTENEKLEPYLDEPRDNIMAIAGPWNGRLFTLTSEGYVYPSLQTTPNCFNTFQVIDLSNMGDPLWMVKTSSGIHVGSERDVIFLAGTGDEDENRTVIDLYPHPLNIGTPPVDKANYVDGNSILYRSADGLIMLASQGLTHVPDDGVRLLWRGHARHGLSALNLTTGRFRLTVDNKILFALVAEGAVTEGSTVLYRLDLGKGQWSRLVYPDPILSLHTEPDGTTIAGTNNGKLLELEYGTGDESADPAVTLWTPYSDGGNPLARKDAFDLQFHTDTHGNTATVGVYKDGGTSSAASYTFSTSQPQAYRIQADDVGAFIRAQLRLTGSFDEMSLSMFDLTYRVRPQHMTFLDTGYLVADDPADVVWLQEVEVDANTPSDLWVDVYLDDRLYSSQSVPVTANVRKVYRVPLPRGCKSTRPRLVVRTSAADGAGEIGFDPYFVRVRTRNSGNQSGNRFKTVWPAGNAP
jgi:hypothetical protein